jgi:hypothetical protein
MALPCRGLEADMLRSSQYLGPILKEKKTILGIIMESRLIKLSVAEPKPEILSRLRHRVDKFVFNSTKPSIFT